jgi:hypothetical protein
MLMKTKEKASARGRETGAGPGGQKRLGDIAPHKDVKNEG